MAIKKAFNHCGDVDYIVSEAFNIDYESMFIGIGKYTEDVKRVKIYVQDCLIGERK
ncbi:hypothetical protein [Borrelia hermsii]|uniref:Uncharacterized protein n=1 Tax=Borrelia hermsii TaxID=140 RepID=S4VU69_BORHE|nr:hypothetical protein [Borrelia hermsii]AGO68849.1 hypothetical protein BHA157 [Borrelia hermsii]UCP02028.1 hypothetical protein K9R62_05155 [Borrelia hermsii]